MQTFEILQRIHGEKLEGIILGTEMSGGKFIKVEENKIDKTVDIFFDIKKGSVLDNKESQEKAAQAYNDLFKLRLRIRVVE